MRLIDAHCHFEHAVFDGRRPAILAQCLELGITGLVIPSTREAEWSRVKAVAHDHDNLFYGLGLHPWWAEEHSEAHLNALAADVKRGDPQLVAIGECGLDRLKGDVTQQLPWFQAQVALARDFRMPLMIHSVRTHEDVIRVLRQTGFSGRGLLHGFSGSYQQARQLVGRGLTIGVTGVITYERARKTRDAVARLPLSSLVLETDAPDMPPAGLAKGENSPLQLTAILDALVALRQEQRGEIVAALQANARQLYGLPE